MRIFGRGWESHPTLGEFAAGELASGRRLRAAYQASSVSLQANAYSSLHHDLTQGKRLELEALHGHAVRLAERHGVPAPTVFAVYAALLPYRDGPPRL